VCVYVCMCVCAAAREPDGGVESPIDFAFLDGYRAFDRILSDLKK